jgi:polyisoprenoid-binding protein YceI
MFRDLGGRLVLDEVDPSKSSVQIEVKTGSVETFEAKRDQHLRSPDFFSAKQFPTATFKSNRVEKTGTGYRVSGDFTLRGVTKPLTIDVVAVGSGKDGSGNNRRGFETSFAIKRFDHGISYMPDGLSDEVTLIVALSAVQK